MKRFLLGLILLSITTIYLTAQETATSIEWLSWEEAMQRMETQPKKVFIDVYTDWCGWCKKMDKSTFVDPAVVNLMNEHFYAVKLDAEQEAAINFDGHEFKYIANAGRRGVHELAYSLLDGRMSYPSFVYLDEGMRRISIAPGYKDASMMATELQFIGGEHFQQQSFDEYKAAQGNR